MGQQGIGAKNKSGQSVPELGVTPQVGWIHPDEHQREVGRWPLCCIISAVVPLPVPAALSLRPP
jgi:hypothetical protein